LSPSSSLIASLEQFVFRMPSSAEYGSPSERDIIEEKPNLSHTVSAGAISISPELFEKVCRLTRSSEEAGPFVCASN
jgi:hypothetical protein